jgi:hypothetical protein
MEPELIYDHDPDGIVFARLASPGGIRVSIRLPPDAVAGQRVQLLDGLLQPIAEHEVAGAATWELALQPGLYLARITDTNWQEIIEVRREGERRA